MREKIIEIIMDELNDFYDEVGMEFGEEYMESVNTAMELTALNITDKILRYTNILKGDGLMNNELLWDILKDHFGHEVEIAIYGDIDNPASITLEDMDTGTVILDAELYTICGREDI